MNLMCVIILIVINLYDYLKLLLWQANMHSEVLINKYPG